MCFDVFCFVLFLCVMCDVCVCVGLCVGLCVCLVGVFGWCVRLCVCFLSSVCLFVCLFVCALVLFRLFWLFCEFCVMFFVSCCVVFCSARCLWKFTAPLADRLCIVFAPSSFVSRLMLCSNRRSISCSEMARFTEGYITPHVK